MADSFNPFMADSRSMESDSTQCETIPLSRQDTLVLEEKPPRICHICLKKFYRKRHALSCRHNHDLSHNDVHPDPDPNLKPFGML